MSFRDPARIPERPRRSTAAARSVLRPSRTSQPPPRLNCTVHRCDTQCGMRRSKPRRPSAGLAALYRNGVASASVASALRESLFFQPLPYLRAGDGRRRSSPRPPQGSHGWCWERLIYAHSGGQYEWDSAAPVAVATAAGLHASRLDGSPLRYGQADPWLPDLLICRPDLAQRVIAICREVAVL